MQKLNDIMLYNMINSLVAHIDFPERGTQEYNDKRAQVMFCVESACDQAGIDYNESEIKFTIDDIVSLREFNHTYFGEE